ncbi:nitrate reductase [Dyadobacter sp. NIV53]|uniref:nitrate reductase n=1 Tax=Dyadobacter sp. NIV53 TaxID=2861765 RepID=UPI001E316119|nr:nitrate reductase [Dyadobacter sp. NIV53]
MKTTVNTYKSTCCYCGVGCGVVVHKQSNDRLTLEGDISHPSSKGMLCSKGMNLHYTVMDQSDRLLFPQMRMNRSMPLQRATWDEALERTAAVFKALIKKFGPDSVAFYVSGQCLTEEYYLVNKLIKGFIGSNNIDTNSRLCMSSAVVGYKLALGEDSVPVCYDDIEEADVFFVTGANPAWCHPILWRRIEAHKTANPHVKIICVDPRRTDTARSADLHLAINPGTDIVLNNAIGRVLIEENYVNEEFINNHTDGFEAFQIKVFERTISESAEICGINKKDIYLAAKWIGQSKGFLSLWTMGLNQSAIGVNKNLSLINLHLITGRIGTPGNGPFSLTGQPNAMGGRETGGLANILPAHRDVTNAVHRGEMETFWNSPVKIAHKPGFTATEMFDALADEKLKAIWIINTNPLVSMPDLNATEKALKNARFVVVQDISNRADTVAFADVVLPAAAWLEKEGTMTNAERRITHLPKVVDAPGDALPDSEIIWRFAEKMGFGNAFNYKNVSEVYDEYTKITAGTSIDITGVNYELLKKDRSIQWPYFKREKEKWEKGGKEEWGNGEKEEWEKGGKEELEKGKTEYEPENPFNNSLKDSNTSARGIALRNNGNENENEKTEQKPENSRNNSLKDSHTSAQGIALRNNNNDNEKTEQKPENPLNNSLKDSHTSAQGTALRNYDNDNENENNIIETKNHNNDTNKGTKRLFTDHQFYTPNKRAQIFAVNDENTSEPTDEDFPLVLTTGRIRDQWHTMTKTGRVSKLNQHIPQPFLQIHPDDAKERKITEGQLVLVTGRRGEVRVKAQITEDVKSGLCFLPMHWGKMLGSSLNRANNLTSPLVDPRSKEPDFKFSAVEVTVYKKPIEKIIVVGAGSAGLGFINTYRTLNQEDEIHVFSKEIFPFYNRVLLPDYISGTQTWEQLVKLREDQFKENSIIVHKGIGIVHIDRKNKIVVDSNGQEHGYDKLILGMGSRAFMPKGVPELPGIFNMRSRLDADSLLPFLKQTNPHAVIVGGGILGLELAASFREMQVKVTVIQRSGRLMERQLDPLASELLYQDLTERGVDIFFNDEVSTFSGTGKVDGIRLKSGRKIACQVVVLTIGTVPAIELAVDSGIAYKRGIVANDYMQTSDPDIFTSGEIAEWRGQMWGITLAAEQQAEVAARYIAGDISQPYKGSTSMNILKMEGLHLCSIGMTEVPSNDPAYEEIVFIDKSKRYYKKCIVHQDKLVGAILIGDKNEFLEFKDLIANGIELSEKRLQLLRASKKVDPVEGKLVCSCNSVGKGNLENAIRNGCDDFQQLCQKTGAGTGCGSCRPEVRAILEKMKESCITT